MWTAHKLFFLCHYLVQVSQAMYANAKYPNGLTYIDLFAGSGACNVRDDDNIVRRYPGSALIAASLREKPFSRLVLVDESAQNLEALKTRIQRTGFAGGLLTWNGDVNHIVAKVADAIPDKALNVAFVDPYSLDVHFSTIRQLARTRPLDLIILFSDRIDLGRNVHKTYFEQVQSKLDEFLGDGCDWRAKLGALSDQSGPKVRRLFADIYRAELSKIGYRYTQDWPLNGPQGPMFRLVFASKHPLGLKFCDIALKEDFGGEQRLF